MSEVEKVLNSFYSNVIGEAKKILVKKDKNASSALSNSLGHKVKVSKNSFESSLSMLDYGTFKDKGVTGKNDPNFNGKDKKVWRSKAGYRFGSGNFKGKGDEWKKRINAWMYSRGIIPRDKKTGKFIKRDTVNFLIRRSIYQHGSEPTLFLTNPFDKYFKTLPEKVVEAYALEVEDLLEFSLKK